MNEEAELTSTAASPPRTGKAKKALLFAVLMLVLGVVGGAAYLMFSDDSSPAAQASQTEKAVMPLEPFLVNLADRDMRRYLKVKIELQADQEKTVKDLEKSLPRMRDALILLLSSKTYEDIATMEGKRQLKLDIAAKLAPLPGGANIKDVYFTEFVAQ
jgi:flagellar protein FliL